MRKLLIITTALAAGACTKSVPVTTPNISVAANTASAASVRTPIAKNTVSSTRGRFGENNSIGAQGEFIPPNAQPGECFAKVVIPPKYETVSEQVLVREAGEDIALIPAKYETGTEQIVIEEASEKLVVVPATYETVSEQVVVQPAKTTLRTVPAKYKTVTEKVLDKPAHTAWKKGTSNGAGQTRVNSSGEIMCLVEYPATYKTISRQVLVSPASTTEQTVPAVTKTITRRVVKTPATTRTVAIPAKYGTVKVTKLVEPAREVRKPVPAKYGSVTKTNQVSEGRLEWRSILCQTNSTPAKIREIQASLRNKGYKVAVDGNIGAGTMRAINDFQRKNSLPVDSYLNTETVKALGINLL